MSDPKNTAPKNPPKVEITELEKARVLIAEEEAKIKAAAAETAKKQAMPKKFVEGRYICVQKCYHFDKMYERGEVAWFTDAYPTALTKKDDKGNQFVAHFKLIED